MTSPETHSFQKSQSSTPSIVSHWILDSYQPGQRKLLAVFAMVRAWLSSGYLSLSCRPKGHVRGWLEGELGVQGDWVGKLGVCVRRPVGLGVCGVED
jgi:hypothetical protein